MICLQTGNSLISASLCAGKLVVVQGGLLVSGEEVCGTRVGWFVGDEEVCREVGGGAGKSVGVQGG